MAVQNPANLISNLASSKALKANDGAYQTIIKLIGLIGSNNTDVTNLIQNNTDGLAALILLVDLIKNATFLTESDELAVLPNSRELVAGSNITFNLLTPGQLIISSTGGGGSATDHVVLSDGGEPPLPIDNGFGSFIYIEYTA